MLGRICQSHQNHVPETAKDANLASSLRNLAVIFPVGLADLSNAKVASSAASSTEVFAF